LITLQRFWPEYDEEAHPRKEEEKEDESKN